MTTTTQKLDVVPLGENLGAEIRGIDIAAGVDAETFAEIRRIWLENLVVVFRDQNLTEDQQVAFCKQFGQLGKRQSPTERRGVHGTNDYIMLISNIRENGEPIGSLPDGEMMFHSDFAYVDVPHMATVLYSIEVPAHGGNTNISNQYLALERLPPEIRAQLEGRDALQIYNYGTVKVPLTGDLSGFKQATHPVITVHPETGRKLLYVSRLMTGRIEGLPNDESEALLEELYQASEDPDLIYSHNWRPGDVLIWDNRCCNHAREDFPDTERRLMRRCTVSGDAPPIAG